MPDGVGAERGTHRFFLLKTYGSGQRARVQHQREIRGLLLGEATLNDAPVADLAIDDRGRNYAAVQYNCQQTAHVLPGNPSESGGSIACEIEIHLRPAVDVP